MPSIPVLRRQRKAGRSVSLKLGLHSEFQYSRDYRDPGFAGGQRGRGVSPPPQDLGDNVDTAGGPSAGWYVGLSDDMAGL